MVKDFFVGLLVFLGLDAVWLGVAAKGFYSQELGHFKRAFRWPAAAISYLLILVGLLLFAFPKVKTGGPMSFLWGSFFGLIAYGVYDLVNLATLSDWTLKMTLVDMFWGGIVCGLVSLAVKHFS